MVIGDDSHFRSAFSFDAGSPENAGAIIGWIGGLDLPDPLAEAIRGRIGDEAVEVGPDGRFRSAVKLATAMIDRRYGSARGEPQHVYVAVEDQDISALVCVLEYAQSTLKTVQSPVGFAWAAWRDRLAVDAFHGGAVVVARGRPSRWLDTIAWLQENLADPRLAKAA